MIAIFRPAHHYDPELVFALVSLPVLFVILNLRFAHDVLAYRLSLPILSDLPILITGISKYTSIFFAE